jgi:signal transduction histidine kinase
MCTRGRWTAIGLAVVLVFVVELLSDTVLDERLPFPFDTVLVTGTVLAIALVASALAFRSIDRLSTALQARNRQLEARNASARALHQVTIAVAALRDLDQILAATVEHARVLLRSDVAVLARSGDDGRLHVTAVGGSESSLASMACPADDVASLFAAADRAALLASPLQHGGQTLGVLAVASRSTRAFDVNDLETLGSLASQAAIAIEQDRVQQQVRELAVQRERDRIARDLHDGIAQVLGYVSTKTEAIDHLLEHGRVPEARTNVQELGAASRSVYVDVRTAIGRLASTGGRDDSWPAQLSATVRRFADTSKVAAVVELDPRATTLALPPESQEQLIAIVREALTNVQKHATAARVKVSADLVADRLRVEVRDDGRGFNTADFDDDQQGDTSGWPRYGLLGMRQRAESIRATVDWRSAFGGGTVVTVVLPPMAAASAARPGLP